MHAIAIETVPAASWAEFSGDWNNIHFDRAAAMRLGAGEVVVHGMIPIVLAQHQLDRFVAGRSSAAWRECKVRLKRPILRGERVHLVMRPNEAGARFTLEGLSGTTHLVGSFEGRDAPPGYGDDERRPTWELPPFVIDAATLRSRLRQFAEVFPSVRAPWIGMSAHLFGEFLVRHQGWLREASLAYLPRRPRSVDELIVVQTSHLVAFDARRINDVAAGALTVTFVPIAISSLPEACTTEARIRVSDEAGRLFEMSVGILIREAEQR